MKFSLSFSLCFTPKRCSSSMMTRPRSWTVSYTHLMMPFMLRFLSTGIEGAEYIQTTTSIESYVNLCLTMLSLIHI